MKKYHKIQTVFKRDPANKHKTLLIGEYSTPEFEYLAAAEWNFTEKVDGTNIRIRCMPCPAPGETYGVTFGGKTDNAQLPAFLVSELERLFHRDKQRVRLADLFPSGGCLYGEGYGAKIQKGGGNYRPDQGFVLFDVRVGDWWLQQGAVIEIANELGISAVPHIGHGTLGAMVEMACDGFNSQWGEFPAEGIVARPTTELCTRSGHRIITKIKHKDFPTRESKG